MAIISPCCLLWYCIWIVSLTLRFLAAFYYYIILVYPTNHRLYDTQDRFSCFLIHSFLLLPSSSNVYNEFLFRLLQLPKPPRSILSQADNFVLLFFYSLFSAFSLFISQLPGTTNPTLSVTCSTPTDEITNHDCAQMCSLPDVFGRRPPIRSTSAQFMDMDGQSFR